MTLDAAIRVILTYLANVLWQAPVILGLAAIGARLFRRTPWSRRHLLWVAALLLCAALPLLGFPGLTGNWFRFEHRDKSIPLNGFFLWILVACYGQFLLGRLIAFGNAWRHTRRLRRRASLRPAPGSLGKIATRCARAWPGSGSDVPVFCSPDVAGPVTLGFLSPILILPERFCEGLEEADSASAIYHEFAHIQRRDYLLNIVYQALYLPVSFHPAAAIIKARVDQTRELACDEMAAEKMGGRTEYARSLLNLAQSMVARRDSSYALGLFDADTLEERIKNLLDPSSRGATVWGNVLALLGAGLLAAGCLALSLFSLQIAHPANVPRDVYRKPPELESPQPRGRFQTARMDAIDEEDRAAVLTLRTAPGNEDTA